MFPRTIFHICASLLLVAASFAQSPTTTATDTEKAERAKKVLTVLEDLLLEAQSMKLPENRAFVQATAAEILWAKDEARARLLFQAAAATIAQMMQDIESDDPNFYQRIQAPQQLRNQLMQMMARRDAQLALEFLRSTRAPKHPDQASYTSDPEAQLEMLLASQVAQTDPKRALQIAEENLSKGVLSEIGSTLHQLHAKDPETAQRLTVKIVQQLKSEDFQKNYQGLHATTLLLSMAVQEAGQNNPKQRPLLSEQDKKELVDLLIAAALKPPKGLETEIGRQALHFVRQYLPLIEKYAPTQAPTLRQKLPAINSQPNPHEKAYQDFNQLQQNGTLAQMLEFAKQSPSELRGNFYGQAAWKAANQGEVERAREIINVHVPPAQRRNLLENITTNQMHRLASEGKIEEARRELSGLSSNERKAGFMLQLIDIIAPKAEKKALVAILEEARALMNTQIENQNHFYTQMQIIHRFVQYDPDRSWELFDPYIPQLNVLLAAAETLDKIEERHAFHNGELRLQSQEMAATNLLNHFAEALAAAATMDFDRAKAIANRFDRSDVRVLAQLSLVRRMGQDMSADLPIIHRNLRHH